MAEESNSEEKKRKKLSVLRGLLPFILPYKAQLIGALLALLFTAIVTLSIGQGVKLVIDNGFIARSPNSLQNAVLYLLVLAFLMATGSAVRFFLVSWLGERVSADIRNAVFKHLVTLSPGYFETNRSGEIMSRLTTDTTVLQSIIGSSFSMALRNAVMLVGALIILLVTNLKLTGMVLLAVPLVLLPLILFGRRVRSLSRKSQDSIADVGSYAGEVIQNIRTVQSYTQEEQEVTAFDAEVDRAFSIAKRRIRQRAALVFAVILIVFAALGAMLWVGGSDVLSGKMTAGELGAFIFYALLASSAIATLSEVYGELQRAAGATERLLELMQVPNDIDSSEEDTALKATGMRASIQLEKVTFSYPSRPKQTALKNFSLNIEEGKSLALVGPSGAGKSTVFQLLQRFYDPQQGLVLLDGTDIRKLNKQDLRRQISVVAQNPVLFSNSVHHNIRYGSPEASDKQVEHVARQAHAHSFISQLPQGYDSFLGERGVRLSGGQQQRIAIARALLKNPRILLLDEATSSLDTESEHQIQRALEELMRERTTVIIAHRLSTVIHADRIAVLDEGQIVAQGNHTMLMETSELYRRLADLQFKTHSAA